MFRRKSKLERLAERQEAAEFDGKFDDDGGGFVAFLRDRGVRETFESILIAIALALLFRNFLGEAYIIPTGSMASTLQGRHMDVECEKCKFQYRTGASIENNVGGRSGEVVTTICPICQFKMSMDRRGRRDHRSFAGDRILVNKFIYDFQSPERWDVIVFKYPNNGKQNYIKRCIGLPGEGLLIEKGDIYTYKLDGETFADRQIQRKDHRKLLAMLQLVDDSDFVPAEIKEANWPIRWQQRRSASPSWTSEYLESGQKFVNSGQSKGMDWLRYRYARPYSDEWPGLELGTLPDRLKDYQGELITDYYAYGESTSEGLFPDQQGNVARRKYSTIGRMGVHWVGDLGLNCHLKVGAGTGSIAFDVVEGGVHFRCTIDVPSGEAQLEALGDAPVEFVKDGQAMTQSPTAQTKITGPGQYDVRFVNADDCLYLWVNDQPIEFDSSVYRRSDEVLPKWTADDPLDAEPLGIGSAGVQVEIDHIQVLRDIYYVSANKAIEATHAVTQDDVRRTVKYRRDDIANEYGLVPPAKIHEVLRDPTSWNSPESIQLFKERDRDESWVFELHQHPDDPMRDEFMPMGDNSPQSSDARVWSGKAAIDREYLLGRAMYVYWPHAKTKPLPFWPNFERMRLIR